MSKGLFVSRCDLPSGSRLRHSILWSQAGFLAKATFIFAVLAILFILGYMLSRAFK